jgi:hypothetical protein
MWVDTARWPTCTAAANWSACGVAEAPTPLGQRLQLSTLADCALAIGRYPRFRYDASGGGGRSSPRAGGSGPVQFPAQQLTIPPLDWRSTRFLGLPLPPGLSIRIEPDLLEGEIDPATGSVQLHFRARFRFRIQLGDARLYTAPDLLVDTPLTSAHCQGRRHAARGQALDATGTGLLVGVARIPPSGAPWLDRFLGLPDEALAVLRCRITPEAEPAA